LGWLGWPVVDRHAVHFLCLLKRLGFVIANEVWRSIVEKAESWIAALRSQ
jgi:hypothetical protein